MNMHDKSDIDDLDGPSCEGLEFDCQWNPFVH